MIGVILSANENKYTLNKEIYEVINHFGKTAIGIIKYDEKILSMLDGAILQGGSDITLEDLKIVNYLYENDIPTLGICLGMQIMSSYKNGELDLVDNHYLTNHFVKIDISSVAYTIFKKDKIKVNSRHHYKVLNTSLDIVGKNDDVIEIVEDKNKKFFIGVQFHPETDFLENEDYYNLFCNFFSTLS